jgi:hypothetical protein
MFGLLSFFEIKVKELKSKDKVQFKMKGNANDAISGQSWLYYKTK